MPTIYDELFRPPGGVMLERLVMLGGVVLIAFGIVTAFFR
jgi:hypothetical protein